MNDSPDRRSHKTESTEARCIVCGHPKCRGAESHGLYKSQLAQTGAEIHLSYEPVMMGKRPVAYLLFAWWEVDGRIEIDCAFIRGVQL